MTSKHLRLAIFFIATSTLNQGATAQIDPKISCPSTQDMKAEHLFGLWAVRFTNPPAGLPVAATMLLERHAEFSDSLAGHVNRDLGAAAGSAKIAGHSAKAELAGDLENGMLLLDESSDNLSISGTWNGEMLQGSCGREFQGTWKDTSSSAAANAADVPFRLHKLP